MSFLLRNARKEKLFDVRKRGGHTHAETGEECDGLCCGEVTIADFEASAKDEAQAVVLTCLDCGAPVALSESEVACEMERAAKALLNAADDLFRLALGYQRELQIEAVLRAVRRGQEKAARLGGAEHLEEVLRYDVRATVDEIRREVTDLHQRRYSNLG
jgi:hypothetical protein